MLLITSAIVPEKFYTARQQWKKRENDRNKKGLSQNRTYIKRVNILKSCRLSGIVPNGLILGI